MLAGALLGVAKDSVGPGPPPVVFFHLPVQAHWQALGHREAPAVGGTCATRYSIPIIPSLQEAQGQPETLS